MTRSQRILVGVGLLLLAWLLHVNLCDWVYNSNQRMWQAMGEQYQYFQFPMIVYRTTDPLGREVRFTGILTQPWVERGTAIVWGLAVPLALVLTDLYLALGWRRQARIRKGLCANCGYDLRGRTGDSDQPCPECGVRPPVRPPGP